MNYTYQLKHKRVVNCRFCKSSKIVNTVDYLNEIQQVSCLNCRSKYRQHGRSLEIVREGVLSGS